MEQWGSLLVPGADHSFEVQGNFSVGRKAEAGGMEDEACGRNGTEMMDGLMRRGVRDCEVKNALKMLSQFTTGKDGAAPKKEYFRIAHIRSFNKSLRQIRTRKWPKRGLHALDSSSELARQNWRQYYFAFKAVSPQCNFGSNPALLSERSFNNRYCMKLFSSESVRKLYFAFTELVYSGTDTEGLCEKLRMRCCVGRGHVGECREKWREARRYAQYGMLTELDISPWNGHSWGPPQWFEVEENSPDRYFTSPTPSQ